jgi:hypothetical protein
MGSPIRASGRADVDPVAEWTRWWAEQACSSAGPLHLLAAQQGFAVTTSQIKAHGWGDNDIRRWKRAQQWCSPRRGVHSPVVTEAGAAEHVRARRNYALRCTAAALNRPGQVISGRGAGVLHGVPVLWLPVRPELTVAAEQTLGRRTRAHLYCATLEEADVTSWFGAPVTTVARTVVDLGRHDRRDAIMAFDAALRADIVTVEAMSQALDRARGWPGSARAREVLWLASPLSESPLESLVRLALHDSGFPPPQLQAEITDPELGRVYRVDLLWERQRLVLEADGRGKYSGDELWQEKRRETRLRRLGYRVERVLWRDVASGWPAFAAHLALELNCSLPGPVGFGARK